MSLYEIVVINVILTTFPVFIWLFYMTYNKNIGKKENELLLDFSIFTILYLIIRFAPTAFVDRPLLIINIPLILAYFKRRYITGVMTSITLIIYSHHYFNINLIILFIEYIVCYLVYMIWFKLKYNRYLLMIFIAVINSVIYIYWINSSNYYGELSQSLIIKATFTILLLPFISYIVIKLCSNGEGILKYHMNLKELEQEKQIRTSLFKITHEIKNPIAVCKGYLDMFDVNDVSHSKKYVPIIKEEIERTLILLQDFLCMTRIQINKEIIDINMILEDVIDNFTPILKEKNIIGDFYITEDSIYIYGDYNRLNQTFINVIKNSIEACDPDKKCIIQIYTRLSDESIKIYIVDNGYGISKENLKRITEPFFTTKNNGTGLGVSLSHEIISGHNGKIIYMSEERNGTTVEITLPLMQKKDCNQ